MEEDFITEKEPLPAVRESGGAQCVNCLLVSERNIAPLPPCHKGWVSAITGFNRYESEATSLREKVSYPVSVLLSPLC